MQGKTVIGPFSECLSARVIFLIHVVALYTSGNRGAASHRALEGRKSKKPRHLERGEPETRFRIPHCDRDQQAPALSESGEKCSAAQANRYTQADQFRLAAKKSRRTAGT